MTTLNEQVRVPLLREAAFDYVADFARQAEWDPNTLSSRRIDGGPMGVGARFALEVRMGRGTASMEYRITEYRRPELVVLIGEGPGIWTRDAISFSETSEGTRVDYVAEIRLQGLMRFVQPLLGRVFDRIGNGAAAGMKRELERLAVTPGSAAASSSATASDGEGA